MKAAVFATLQGIEARFFRALVQAARHPDLAGRTPDEVYWVLMHGEHPVVPLSGPLTDPETLRLIILAGQRTAFTAEELWFMFASGDTTMFTVAVAQAILLGGRLEARPEEPGPPRADTSCGWGWRDCNPCAPDVLGQIDTMTSGSFFGTRIRFRGRGNDLINEIDGAYAHIQGMARIPGVGRNEYLVFTTSSDRDDQPGYIAVAQLERDQYSGGHAFQAMPHGGRAPSARSSGGATRIGYVVPRPASLAPPAPEPWNRTVGAVASLTDHPGGLSVLGKYAFVAEWCQGRGRCAEHRWGFAIYDLSAVDTGDHRPHHVHYQSVLWDDWIGSKSTAGVAAVKLTDGSVLVALSRSGGDEYGFYLGRSMRGPYEFLNASGHLEYESENASMVTSCDGRIFLLGFDQTYPGWHGQGRRDDRLVVREVLLDSDGDRITGVRLKFLKRKTFRCRGVDVDGASSWCDFGAGGSAYVDPAGALHVYASERHQSEEGNVRLIQFSSGRALPGVGAIRQG